MANHHIAGKRQPSIRLEMGFSPSGAKVMNRLGKILILIGSILAFLIAVIGAYKA
ncbi:hypothetical protein ACFL2X_02335 [Candidatus Latescibacterota bacterium]